jgi:protease-4
MKIMETMVANIYDDFTSKVAAGRKKTQAEVDSIGQGRVWSGEDALALGLVDELGNLEAAIKAAAEMAGITDYETVNYPEAIDPFKQFIEELSGQKVLGDQFRFYEQLKSIRKMQGVQARMPYLIEIY